jgi:hypothetical protein
MPVGSVEPAAELVSVLVLPAEALALALTLAEPDAENPALSVFPGSSAQPETSAERTRRESVGAWVRIFVHDDLQAPRPLSSGRRRRWCGVREAAGSYSVLDRPGASIAFNRYST